jgi:uncharacterized membrane protein YesL
MGLFFNYNKPGPGISKDAPKKKGIFLYLELFFRKFWLLMKANMLYFAVSLPVIAVYNFIIINALSIFLPAAEQEMSWHISLIFTAIITIIWGTGPVSGGYAYILRGFAREEHVWIVSDFFEKIRETFKLGMIMLIMDIVLLIFGINAVSIYLSMIKSGYGFAKYALSALAVIFVFYTFLHYYVYEFGVTFENGIKNTLKNALITGIATLPANLFLTVFAVSITVLVFGRLTVLSIILLLFLMWISFMRFPIDFYAARMIKRRFIDGRTGESGKQNDGIS